MFHWVHKIKAGCYQAMTQGKQLVSELSRH